MSKTILPKMSYHFIMKFNKSCAVLPIPDKEELPSLCLSWRFQQDLDAPTSRGLDARTMSMFSPQWKASSRISLGNWKSLLLHMHLLHEISNISEDTIFAPASSLESLQQTAMHKISFLLGVSRQTEKGKWEKTRVRASSGIYWSRSWTM